VVPTGFGEEFVGIHFNDQRLTNRVVTIAEQLGKHCCASIPAATDGRAEMEAVYRFMNNPKVSPEKLTERHCQATLERMQQCDVVLLVQDTTELDLTRPSQQVAGAGPLNHDSRRGSYYHPLMAFDTEGVPLGIPWYEHWVREAIQTDRTIAQKREDVRSKSIEEKESFRWLKGVRAAREIASHAPETQCVVVGDSESDIYEVLAEPRETEDGRCLEILVRAACDRNLEVEDGEDKLLARVRSTPCLFRYTVHVSRRTAKTNSKTKSPRKSSRKVRVAEVEVRATTVTVRSPRNSTRRPSLTYNVVLIEEASPPKGEAPIQWLLITSLPIETEQDIRAIVRYYCHRWQIEIYFRTLKSGCRIQERYFETMNRMENCLAIYSVIAWKIVYLCALGRECPDLPCDVVFTDSEWKSVYTIISKEEPGNEPPTLNEMIRMISSLGGYVRRKTTHPGTQTLWLGLQRLYDFANAWESFGPECQTRT
jgi:hypothetical protein